MARKLWIDATTGDALDAAALAELRDKAHVVYLANGHIFEDEDDALAALGAVPLRRRGE
jgi:hypothetical protein